MITITHVDGVPLLQDFKYAYVAKLFKAWCYYYKLSGSFSGKFELRLAVTIIYTNLTDMFSVRKFVKITAEYFRGLI